MTQNIIKLIALYLLSIFIISCGSSDDGGLDKGNSSNNNNGNNDNNKTTIPITNVVFTSPNKASVSESELNAITLTATGNNPIIYSISGNDSSSFNINSSTGVVVFKVKPDYETKTTYSFTATAKDSKNNEDVANIIISIIDVDEKPPLFVSSGTLRIKENTLRAIIVKTKDDSIVTYSISNEADGGQFDINTTSGEITFKKAPDYESKKISYSLNVIAKDTQNNQSNQNINITILDIEDETKPIWVSPNIVHVDENQLNAITLKAEDDDSSITYSINIEYAIPGTNNAVQVDEDDSHIFTVNHISGKVTFKATPDYESKKSYKFIAKATDSQGNEATQNIKIYIRDVDDTPPVFTPIDTMSFKENSIHSFTLKATDENNITYSINGDDSDSFDVNHTSGLVSFKKEPDYESKKSYSFTAIAKDSKDNVSTQNIEIKIIDIEDEIKPIWVSGNIETIKEDEINATILKATDENKITYSISEHNDSFDVNGTTGLVTFKKRANYQHKPSYKFIAHATDKDGNVATKNMTINLTFVEDIRRTFRGHASSVHSLALTPSGKYVLSGSGDNTLKLWKISTGELIKTFTSNHINSPFSVAITLDEKYIILGSGHNLNVLDINTSGLIKHFTGHTALVHSIALSKDGKYVLSGGGHQDKTIKLWNIKTGALTRTFTGHTAGVHSVAISPNGEYIVSGSNDETVKLWNTNTGALIQTFNGHTSVVDAVAITPNGEYIVSGSNDETIKLWNTNTGALIRTFKGHTDNILSISITPNGKYALSGSGDNTLKLWKISTGELMRTFNGHNGEISSTIITQNGKYALSGSWDHTLKLWSLDITNP